MWCFYINWLMMANLCKSVPILKTKHIIQEKKKLFKKGFKEKIKSIYKGMVAWWYWLHWDSRLTQMTSRQELSEKMQRFLFLNIITFWNWVTWLVLISVLIWDGLPFINPFGGHIIVETQLTTRVRQCLKLHSCVVSPCRLVYPLEMFTAVVVVPGVSVGSVWAGQNRAAISSFQRQNPAAFLMAVVVTSCLVIYILGSLMVVLFAVTLPLSRKFLSPQWDTCIIAKEYLP